MWSGLIASLACLAAPDAPTASNTLGQRFVRLPPGHFAMGSTDGEWDERPVHAVTLTRPFLMATTPVTNAQYELFDPDHVTWRRPGTSSGDDEAVLFVNWHEAMAFCAWLSAREGRPYRLPTEAEWEYACRAGSTADFWSHGQLPEADFLVHAPRWEPEPADLNVFRGAANRWGLRDMCGVVEQWCLDGYGPYPDEPIADPVGRAEAVMRVTRGGSHNSAPEYQRSAARAGSLPDDRSWAMGFRLVCAEPPGGEPLPPPPPARWATRVSQAAAAWTAASEAPYFRGPLPYVHIPPDADGPLFARHNHCPAITWCPNGDLLAAWFSCRTEEGREMTVAASRLRRGTAEWEPADEFFKAPARNMTGTCLWHDGAGTLFHFNGLGVGFGWSNLVIAMRVSHDNGVTWQTRLMEPLHRKHNQVIANLLRLHDGTLLLCCDAVPGGSGGTAVHLSHDGGQTWSDPSEGRREPKFENGAQGAWIAGIHGATAELADGSLFALGRGDDLHGRMTCSRSTDGGHTWTYSPSPFPAISSGQRLVLLRLREGPLLFCSFTDSSAHRPPLGMTFALAEGGESRGYGLFAALSDDDGKTWPVRKLITPGQSAGEQAGGAWTGAFTLDAHHAEPAGYLAATQTPDGIVQLISSRLHYRFNVAWLRTPAK
jgi:formylglycine-generating enzyme required for sulfatase activity